MNYYVLCLSLSVFATIVPLADPSRDDEFIDKKLWRHSTPAIEDTVARP